MTPFFLNQWIRIKRGLTTVFSALLRTPASAEVKVLCVDDDPDFCLYIERLARSLGIAIDKAYTIASAKQLIEKTPDYKAFLIDGHLPEGSGFELAAWIRQKKRYAAPIAFLSRVYQDAASFRTLKEQLSVDYVLEKPISPEELKRLLMRLCRLEEEGRQADESLPKDVLAELREIYGKSIFDKVERIEKLVLAVQKNPVDENLQALKGEVHKIAGSAGSYGYMAVSDLCKNLELGLSQKIALEKQGKLDRQWLSDLDVFFTQIKLGFQCEPLMEPIEEESHLSHFTSVYVVDEEESYLSDFKSSAAGLHFDVLTEDHPDKAIQTLLTADFYPQIFLLGAHYSKTPLTAFDLIKAFYQSSGTLTTIVGVIVEEGCSADQITALKRGVSFILGRELKAAHPLALLDQAPFRELPLAFKVLIVDDDPDICHYIHQTLNVIGLTIKSVSDPNSVQSIIERDHPDLILLDVNLKDHSGARLIDLLHHHWGYRKLLIGMITPTREGIDFIHECYEANVDEIIFKPLEGGILQRKVAGLLRKHTDLLLESAKDASTGLSTPQTWDHYLDTIHSREVNDFAQTIVVFFELEGGSPENVKRTAQAFDGLVEKYELAADLGSGRFSLVFRGMHINYVQLVVRTFLENLQDEERNIAHTAIVLRMQGEEAKRLRQRGEEVLQRAKQLPAQSIRLNLCEAAAKAQSLKKVAIFHEDASSLEWMKVIFDAQGFETLFISEFGEGFQWEGSLWIMVGAFAEKGTGLLKNFTLQQHLQFPILAQLALPSIKDLEQFLKGIDYFDAPFPLALLYYTHHQ